jgi:hypothetical protein
MECWSVGVLECWSDGAMERWSVGVLRSARIARRDCGLGDAETHGSVRSVIFIAIVSESGDSSARSDIQSDCLLANTR